MATKLENWDDELPTGVGLEGDETPVLEGAVLERLGFTPILLPSFPPWYPPSPSAITHESYKKRFTNIPKPGGPPLDGYWVSTS